MKNDGWKFIEQNGSGYFLKKRIEVLLLKVLTLQKDI